MFDNVLKFFFKNLYDENVKRKITKILTFSNRFLREMYVVTKKSKRIKQKFQKLQNEKNQLKILNFYKNIVKRNMFSKQIQVLMIFYTNQHVSFYFFRSNQSFLFVFFSSVSSIEQSLKTESSYQYENHSYVFFNQYSIFSEQFYQNSVFQNYAIFILHYDTNQNQNQHFQKSNQFYSNFFQASQSKSIFYNYYSFQSFQHLSSSE